MRVSLFLPVIALATAACGGGDGARNETMQQDAVGSGVAEIVGNGEAPAASAGAAPPVETVNEITPVDTAAQAAAPADGEPLSAGDALTEQDVEAQFSPEYDRCLDSGDAARGVTPAMAACVHAELAKQDARLNAAYKSAMAKRDAAGQAKLRQEERAWIKSRDAQCEAAGEGGTIDRINIPSCILRETIRRRVTLQPMAG